MFNRMNVIVCGDEVMNGKPSPDIFLLAASKLGIEPHECLVFEDSLSGVIAGIIITIIYHYHYHYYIILY